jgi:peptide subunit release factor 1 (eRF1)/intein/homing endonuclease
MVDVKKRRELRKFVEQLAGYRGRHTELVTVYIPAGYELFKIINHLKEEQGTASNIKDKRTRTNVIDSLEKMIRHLRLFKKTPDNGLAIFSGNVSDKESQIKLEVFSVEPPEPINMRLYRCDQTFVVDLLRDMVTHKETYGLLVVDRREGTIGLLRGSSVVEIANHTSDVPGKTTKGGQCLVPDSVVQICDGDIEKIGNLHNPYVVKSVELEDGSLIDSAITDKWDSEKKVAKIITKNPRLEIESSLEHTFFVRTDEGIVEKEAEELKEGDFLLMPERIDVKGEIQEILFKDFKVLDQKFAQFLGYYLGDGNPDTNRLVFYEQNKELANYYRDFFSNLFNLDVKVKFREAKNYYEIRIYNKDLHDFVVKEFPEIDKALNSEVPKKILRSPNEILAGFLRGLFDAEGYVTAEELSIGMNNKYLIRQVQMALLRFGIISGFGEYNNERNPYSDNYRYTLRITEKESLKYFKEFIGFSFSEKIGKLGLLLDKRGIKSNVRQIIKTGKEIRKLLEDYGYLKENFSNVSHFFYNRREMGKQVFKKNFMEKVKLENKELYEKLKFVVSHNLIPVKIKSIEISENKVSMVDISVKNQNFVANCVLVHNSQQRYARLREEAAHNFFKRVAETANKEFSDKDVKGVIVGGPGPSKEDFLNGDYLQTRVREKVLGMKDLSYTGAFGLNELVDKSHDLLANEEVVEEKKIIDKFFYALSTKGGGKAAYKKKDVLDALNRAAVDVLILSEDLSDEEMENLEEKAEATGAKVNVVSSDTTEGRQIRDFGGVVAILRYKV